MSEYSSLATTSGSPFKFLMGSLVAFEMMEQNMNQRFNNIERRLDKMDKRLDNMDKRLEKKGQAS